MLLTVRRRFDGSPLASCWRHWAEPARRLLPLLQPAPLSSPSLPCTAVTTDIGLKTCHRMVLNLLKHQETLGSMQGLVASSKSPLVSRASCSPLPRSVDATGSSKPCMAAVSFAAAHCAQHTAAECALKFGPAGACSYYAATLGSRVARTGTKLSDLG